MTKKKLQYKELRSLDSAIEQLQELLDGLRAGTLSLERGDQQLQLKPGAVLDFALYAEREGVQERFELSLEWRRQELEMGSTGPSSSAQSPRALPSRALPPRALSPRALSPRPQSMVVPAGGRARGLALQAEAERLFEEDDSDPPLSSDDDHTLGSDDILDSEDEPTVTPDAVDVPLRSSVAVTSGVTSRVPVVLAQDEMEEEAVTVRHRSPPTGQASAASCGPLSDAESFQQLYAAARMPAPDGQLRLDERRFTASLIDAGLESALQQELCSLARQADEEGREQLFKEPRISELIASTLSGAA